MTFQLAVFKIKHVMPQFLCVLLIIVTMTIMMSSWKSLRQLNKRTGRQITIKS